MTGLGAAATGVGLAAGYAVLVRGGLTLDLGWGRTVRPLGPLRVEMAAPREMVFDVVAAPYLGRTSRGLSGEIEVLERGADMVLAAHHTPVGAGMTTTTVETVRFERPGVVHFRLVRGPVPHVVERFVLHDHDDSTVLEYDGELGTDLWRLGRRWGDVVASRWEATVSTSLERIRAEAERRAAVERRHLRGGGW